MRPPRSERLSAAGAETQAAKRSNAPNPRKSFPVSAIDSAHRAIRLTENIVTDTGFTPERWPSG